jgi:hypothetical protein
MVVITPSVHDLDLIAYAGNRFGVVFHFWKYPGWESELTFPGFQD